MSSDQLYACDLYKFVMSGVVQLIISIIGFVGKSINYFTIYRQSRLPILGDARHEWVKQKPLRKIVSRSLHKQDTMEKNEHGVRQCLAIN